MKTEYNIAIAQQLVKGAHNIDRMRQEIIQVVNTIIGFSKQSFIAGNTAFNETFNSETCVWKVRGERGCERNYINVDCMVRLKIDGKRSEAGYTGYTSASLGKDWFPPGVDTVQDVYQDLSTFVNGMIEKVPGLKEKLQPLLDAAEAI